MRAATLDRYGLDALTLRDEPMPEPAAGEVRIRVIAAAINPADWHLAVGQPHFMRLTEGLRRPKERIVGTDACGVVDAVGPGVTRFEVGDTAFGKVRGAFAEYAVGPADRLALVPTTMSEIEASTLPIAGVTALQAVDLAEVAGRRVVVNGASGGVGHFAVQIARAAGASEVVAVCSGRNAEWVAELGADRVVDYETADFTDEPFDAVIDCIGNRSVADIARCLRQGGTHVVLAGSKKTGVLGPAGSIVRAKLGAVLRPHRCEVLIADETAARLERLAELADDGDLQVRIAGKRPLRDVLDAYDRIESQRTAGKIIVLP